MITQSSPIGASSGLMSGGGMDAIEGRVRQLETMIRQFETNDIKPGDVQQTRKPFQAYLQKNGVGEFPLDTPTPPPQSAMATQPTTNNIRFTPDGLTGALKARFDAFQPLVEKYSQKHGVDADLINAVIRQESGFNPAAKSKAGAQGLMQLMPGTAKSLGVTDPINPEQNVEGGVRLLKSLLQTYNGNIPLALAAYNAGGGAVQKYKGIPPYKETQNYVKTILSAFLAQKGNSEVRS